MMVLQYIRVIGGNFSLGSGIGNCGKQRQRVTSADVPAYAAMRKPADRCGRWRCVTSADVPAYAAMLPAHCTPDSFRIRLNLHTPRTRTVGAVPPDLCKDHKINRLYVAPQTHDTDLAEVPINNGTNHIRVAGFERAEPDVLSENTHSNRLPCETGPDRTASERNTVRRFIRAIPGALRNIEITEDTWEGQTEETDTGIPLQSPHYVQHLLTKFRQARVHAAHPIFIFLWRQ
ncbi:MAG: hypothetical protein GDA53_01030 [Rhodobacteraceae bacterium]|nr:hypothetical protein [Paracoccaceae bacterium]